MTECEVCEQPYTFEKKCPFCKPFKDKVREVINKHWNATKEHTPIDGNYLYLKKELDL